MSTWEPIDSCPADGLFLVYEDGAIRLMFRTKGEWQATAVAVDQYGASIEGVRVRETGVYQPQLWRPIDDLLAAARAAAPEEKGAER
jgi:hypothetical protein